MRNIKLPSGFHDEYGLLAEQKDIISQKILTKFRNKGYTRISTPLLEQEQLFEDYELKEGMYKCIGSDREELVLRPDLTLPIARFLANNNISLPRKFYYLGDKLAVNRQMSGQKNKVTQFGIELVGFDSIKAEAECLLITHWIGEKFLNGQLTIELGDARVVEKVLDSLDIEDNQQQAISNALFAKNFPQYQKLIEQFSSSQVYPFLQKWPRLFGGADEIRKELTTISVPAIIRPIVEELLDVAKLVQQSLAGQKVIIDLSTRIPQKYYTGMIFKAYADVDQSSEYLISGGRYNKLLESFEEQPESAIGLGLNIDLLTKLSAIAEKNKNKLVFSDLANYDKALKLVNENDDYTLAISKELEDAKKEATEAGMELIIIGGD